MLQTFSSCLRILLALAIALLAGPAPAAPPLPALTIDEPRTTVSGISSGGYMAVQFHVAHSSIVRGAGVLAAGPYYCAQGSAWTARYNCMQPGAWTAMPGTDVLVTQTRILARGGLIDDPANLRLSRVWLFSGRNDDTVRPAVVEALAGYYARFVPAGQIAQVRDIGAGHAMITTDYGGACSTTGSPYLNDCDFDAAGALLAHLHGPLLGPAEQAQGELLRFAQAEFTDSPYAVSMDDEGFVYVPQACRDGGCRVHVAFHGCRQGREHIGDQFARHAGYNRWADTNRIVVLYPQAITRYGWGPWPWPTGFVFNPNGCWDWWGYTGVNYHTRAGAQIRAVKAMLERLAAKP
jgi:poly(3-hydroxybutyrate) depolymerase